MARNRATAPLILSRATCFDRFAMLLANLQPVTDVFHFKYAKWTAIAAEMDIQVQYPDFGTRTPEEGKRAWAKMERLIEHAEAFVLEARFCFADWPDLEKRFHERIE